MIYHFQDTKLRQKLCEKVTDYFYSIKIWVNVLLKQQKQNDEIYRLYMVIGYLFERISPLIYVKVTHFHLIADMIITNRFYDDCLYLTLGQTKHYFPRAFGVHAIGPNCEKP